jgi:hypothetical protein
MARNSVNRPKENVYSIVEKLRDQPQKPSRNSKSSRNKAFYDFTNPTALRALRIHRHLKALEEEILNPGAKRTVSISSDVNSDQIILCIQNDEIHCCRVAYLTPQELSFLRKNREIAKILRRRPAKKNVA